VTARELPAAAGPAVPMRAAWWALGVLTLVMLLAVLDRGVLILQAETVRKSLGLSDFELGFLQGTAVSIMVGLVSYPLGWMADRHDRRWVLAGCVTFWCAAVIGSGLAQNYWQLLIGSALVGAGEAGIAPIVNALIPDLFPEKKRQLANSIFALSTTAASALGLGLTGAIIGATEQVRPLLPGLLSGMESWRLSFLAVVLPAPLMVLLIMTIASRRRAGPPAATAAGATTAAASGPDLLLPYLRQHRQIFLCFYGGLAVMTFGFSAVGGWLAVIYQRVYQQTPQQLGAALGSIALASTAIGFLISVWGMRYFAPRVGPRLNVRVLWLAALCAAGAFFAMTFATRAEHMYAIQGVYIVLLTGASMIFPTVVQSLAPAHLRARVYALMGVILSASGAAAPPVVGLLSDQFKSLPNGLIVSAVMVAVPCLAIGAVLMFMCERNYEKTRQAAIDAEAVVS
jgi:MFS family permease